VKRFVVTTISILLLEILMTQALPNIPAVAQDSQAVLRFTPSALGLMPDAQGTVNIVVENVQNLYGLEFQLAFDSNIVEVIDADPDEEGVQIKPADWWTDGFVAVNQVDNRSGRIDFAATLLRPALPVKGNRVIATISFAARNTGTSELSIDSAILSSPGAEAIPCTKQNGKIGVSPSGQAPDDHTRSAGVTPGRLALAGAAILALLTALGLFIYALRKG
jgi:hypothetical protein